MGIELVWEAIEHLQISLNLSVRASVMMGVRIADHVNGTKTEHNKMLEALGAISKADLNLVPGEAEVRKLFPHARDVQPALDYNELFDQILATIFLDERNRFTLAGNKGNANLS